MTDGEVLARLAARCDAWDRMHRHYFPDYDRRWEKVIEILRERSSGRILDLGCGPGTLTARIAAAMPEATVTGVDADALLVAIATTTSAGPRLIFQHTVVGSAGSVGQLRSGAPFDAIVSSAFVHYFDREGLVDLHRWCRGLLADDGVYIAAERFTSDADADASPSGTVADPWRTWWHETAADPAVRRLAGDLGMPMPPPDAAGTPPPPTLDAYLATLVATGYRCSVHDTRPSQVVVASPRDAITRFGR